MNKAAEEKNLQLAEPLDITCRPLEVCGSPVEKQGFRLLGESICSEQTAQPDRKQRSLFPVDIRPLHGNQI
jgi:hypothetical protein